MTSADRKSNLCRQNVFATFSKSMETIWQNISHSIWRMAKHHGAHFVKLKIITHPTTIWISRINRIIMYSIKPKQLHRIISKTTHQTISTIKDMKVVYTSAGMTIDVEAMEVEVDSLGIGTTDHVGPYNVSHAIMRDTDMQTVHTRTWLT